MVSKCVYLYQYKTIGWRWRQRAVLANDDDNLNVNLHPVDRFLIYNFSFLIRDVERCQCQPKYELFSLEKGGKGVKLDDLEVKSEGSGRFAGALRFG